MIKSNLKNKFLIAAALVFAVVGSYSINALAAHGGSEHHGSDKHRGGSEHHGGSKHRGGERAPKQEIRVHESIHVHENNYGRRHDHRHSGGYWRNGGWYDNNGAIVALTIGDMIATLPPTYETVYVQKVPYYRYSNIYYRPTANGYVVVNSPY